MPTQLSTTHVTNMPEPEMIIIGYANLYEDGRLSNIYDDIETCNSICYHPRRSVQKIIIQGPHIRTETVFIDPKYIR